MPLPTDTGEQTANPSQEAGLFPTETAAASPAEDTQASYEVIKGEDGSEHYKVPKADFDELRQGNMRLEDYTRGKQTLQSYADVFGAIFDEPGKQPEQKTATPKPAQPAQPTQYGKPMSPEALKETMSKMTEEQIKKFIHPMQRKMADIELEKEEAEFRSKYSQVFTGDPKKDNTIMNKVIETQLKFSDDKGMPISMERAFFIAFGGNMLGALQKISTEQNNRKDWDTESSSLTKPGGQAFHSSQEADLAVENLIRQKVGYN